MMLWYNVGVSAEDPPETRADGPIDRLQRWLLTEVPEELARPGKLKFTINLDESREDMKLVVERFYNI